MAFHMLGKCSSTKLHSLSPPKFDVIIIMFKIHRCTWVHFWISSPFHWSLFLLNQAIIITEALLKF
jgi:hypothetical protein